MLTALGQISSTVEAGLPDAAVAEAISQVIDTRTSTHMRPNVFFSDMGHSPEYRIPPVDLQ